MSTSTATDDQVTGGGSQPVPVTVEDLIRAESDVTFGAMVERGGPGRWEARAWDPTSQKRPGRRC